MLYHLHNTSQNKSYVETDICGTFEQAQSKAGLIFNNNLRGNGWIEQQRISISATKKQLNFSHSRYGWGYFTIEQIS